MKIGKCYLFPPYFTFNLLLQQQQLSHLSQVFEEGYMNQKRIMPGRAHGSALMRTSRGYLSFHALAYLEDLVFCFSFI